VGPVPRDFGRKLGLAGVLGALLLLCAFAAPAFASGPSWLSPVKLSVDGSDAQTPVIAMDGNGDSDAVWALGSGTLQTSYRAAGAGNPFIEQDVDGSNNSLVPDVAEDGGGDAEAVWIENDSVNWSYRTNDIDGFGAAAGINDDSCSGSESDPRVAVDSNANVIAAYLCSSGAHVDVEAAYAAGGTAGNFNTAPSNPDNGPPVQLSDGLHDASSIQIAEDPNGDAIVVWVEYTGTNTQTWYAYRPAGNSSTWTTPQVVSNVAEDESQPAVAMDGNGNGNVAYQTGGDIEEEDATNGTLAAGGHFAAATTLSTTTTAAAPEIADDANGDTAVVWSDSGTAYANVRPSAGSFAGTPTTLGSVDVGSQPQIALTGTDDAIALWQSGDTIQAETADSSGAFSGTATQLSGSNATEPSLAVDNSGDAVAAWIQSDGTNEIATADGYDSGAGPTNNNLHIAPNGSAGNGLTFYAQPYDVWPAITSESWNFGDGTPTQSGDNVVHTFAQQGNYSVSVTSTDADGNQTTSTQNIDVAASPPTVAGGGLSQLAAPNDCVTDYTVGCGTLLTDGALNDSYQPVVSPDGKNVYAVALSGGLDEFSRNASTGALTEIGCITSASSGCSTNNAEGLGDPGSIAISPDGQSVYVVTQGDYSITAFSRNPTTGLLTELNGSCYSHSGGGGCTAAAGVDLPYGVAVSPDGKNVYVSAYSGQDVAEFTRNTTTGAITPIAGNDCISDAAGPDSCPVTSAVGLLNAVGVTVSPDGNNVYVTAGGTQGKGDVAEFTRDASTGALAPISGNACLGSSTAPSGCLTTATAINGTEDMAINSAGTFAYINSFYNDAVVELARDTTTGSLSQVGCVGTSNAPVGLCSTSNSVGIDNPLGVALSPDGNDLYVSGAGDNAEAAFAVNAATGLVSQLAAPNNCITSNSAGCGVNDATGLQSPRRLALSPDGKNVYVANQGAEGIAELARMSPSEKLTVTVNGSGSGSVSDGGSLNCTTASSPCSQQYTEGTTVTLTETPAGGSTFAGWSGSGCSRTAPTCQVTMSDAESVTAAFSAPPTTKGQIGNGSEASWDTSSTASSASATVTAPAIVCVGEKVGTYSGQAAGVELYGEDTVSGTSYNPAEVADVRTYCDGTKANYETSFVVNDITNDTRVFHPAGLTVSPGDPLDITVSAASSGASMKMTDVNTGKSVSITGPGFVASDGADIGVQPIGSNGHGAPMLSGSESVTSSNSLLDGPVPSSPVVFQDALVNGQAISAPSTLYGLRWVNTSKTVVASPSAISDGDFTIDFASVPTPATAKSADVAPISGKVLIELPGTHKFVPLTSVKKIPDGTLINATKGSVQITVELPNGTTQTGVFFGGEFRLEQAKNGETTAVLAGGSFKVCPKPPSAHKKKKSKKHGPLAQTARASKKHPVRDLWSNAHGSFSTKGRYGAAAVRGTEWLTRDQCDGTYFKVTRDEVQVTSFDLRNRRTLVKQGHSFLAPAPGYK
jgi:6-phosphogluconolactonase (cycloisomerase 2 family)